MNQIAAVKTHSAKELFAAAFEAPRTPRSSQYRDGAMAALRDRERGSATKCPYTFGTPQADAWFSGYEEGKIIYRCSLTIEEASL